VDPQVPDKDQPQQVDPPKVDAPVPAVTKPVELPVPDKDQPQQVDPPKVDAPVLAVTKPVEPPVPGQEQVDQPKAAAQEPQGGTEGKNFDFVSSIVLLTLLLNIQM
jgi:hypothetical protein